MIQNLKMKLGFMRWLLASAVLVEMVMASALAQAPTAPPTGDLALWLRADQGVSVDGSGNVLEWSDLRNVGAGTPSYPVASNPLGAEGVGPRVISSAVNGQPAVRFEPNPEAPADMLKLEDVMPGAMQGEVFILVHPGAAAAPPAINYNAVASFSSYGEYSTVYGHNYITSDFMRSYNVPWYPLDDVEALSRWHIHNVTADPGDQIFRLDRLRAGNALGYTSGTSHVDNGSVKVDYRGFDGGFSLGANIWGSSLNGDIAEVLLYNRKLTSAERDSVYAYIASRFQVIGAPANRGWSAEYFKDQNFGGSSVTRLDPSINVTDYGLPWPCRIRSGRWTGRVIALSTGTYSFALTAKGKVAVWIDGSLAVSADEWTTISEEERTVTFTKALVAGVGVAFKVEYSSGSPGIALRWTPPGAAAPTLVPQQQVDSELAVDAVAFAPVADPVSGVYEGQARDVSLFALNPLSGGQIRYTTDGSEPDETSALYSSPIHITADTTIKARLYANGYGKSGRLVETYLVEPDIPQLSGVQFVYSVDGNDVVVNLDGSSLLELRQNGRFQATISDRSGISQTYFDLVQGGNKKAIGSSGGGGIVSQDFVITNFPDGDYAFEIYTRDNVGTTSAVFSHPVRIIQPQPQPPTFYHPDDNSQTRLPTTNLQGYALKDSTVRIYQGARSSHSSSSIPVAMVTTDSGGAFSATVSLDTTLTGGLLTKTTTFYATAENTANTPALVSDLSADLRVVYNASVPTLSQPRYIHGNESAPTVVPLPATQAITQDGRFAVTAEDETGVQRVLFTLRQGDMIYYQGYSGWNGDTWTADYQVDDHPYGTFTLEIQAWNIVDAASTVLSRTVEFAQGSPLAPVFVSPANNYETNATSVTLKGLAQKNSTVRLYKGTRDAHNSSTALLQSTTADANGEFSFSVNLDVPGTGGGATQQTVFHAIAQNTNPTPSPISENLTIRYNATAPSAPVGLSARLRTGGLVELSWQAPQTGLATGYRIYRQNPPSSAVPSPLFQLISGSDLVRSLSYYDSPGGQGTYAYHAVAVYELGGGGTNVSQPSAPVEVTVDAIAPTATLSWEVEAPRLDTSTTHGPGAARLTLQASEELADIPLLSLATNAGPSLFVNLTQVGATTYSGSVNFAATLPSGPVIPAMSAVDIAGNKGTVVTSLAPYDAGHPFTLDTRGPRATLAVSSGGGALPRSFALNTTPGADTAIQLHFSLDEAVGAAPTVRGKLSVLGTTLTPVLSASGSNAWIAAFTIPAGAAASSAEDLKIEFSATDLVGNVSDSLASASPDSLFTTARTFQLYRGALPPLEAPGPVATPRPAGALKLEWNLVEHAAGYRVQYRLFGATSFTAYGSQLSSTTSTLSIPAGALPDGSYEFQVASVREENGENTPAWAFAVLADSSPPSTTLVIDSVPPSAPSLLVLTKVAQGVQATFTASSPAVGVAGYELYRSSTVLSSVSGADRAAFSVGAAAAVLIDSAPNGNSPHYAVVAYDAAGNRSALAVGQINVSHLPVGTLEVLHAEDSVPVVSWTPAVGSVGLSGYRVTVAPSAPLDLPLTQQSIRDDNYLGGDRSYTVGTVSGTAVLDRSIVLPDIALSLPADSEGRPQTIKRGLMNTLSVKVENRSATQAIEYGRLVLRVPRSDTGAKTEHFPTYVSGLSSVNLAPGASQTYSIIVGGYADLPALSVPLVLSLELAPHAGESVRRTRSVAVPVGEDSLRAELLPGSLLRGGSGSARFRFTNSGTLPVQFMVSHPSLNQCETRISVLNANGETLSSTPLSFTSGGTMEPTSSAAFYNIIGGASFVTVPPGSTFTSPSISFPVPANTALNPSLGFEISSVYYMRGDPDTEVMLAGPRLRVPVLAAETAYYTALDAIPANVTAPVTIQGHAYWRSTPAPATPRPAATVPVLVSVRIDGFVRSETIYTATDGSFTSTFSPGANERGGIYEVWASHPDTPNAPLEPTAQTFQTFILRSVSFGSLDHLLTLPRNYLHTVSIPVETGPGTVVQNLRAVLRNAGGFPASLVIDAGSPRTIGSPTSASSGAIEIKVRGTNPAPGDPAGGKLQFDLLSDNPAAGSSTPVNWGVVTIDYDFVTTTPVLQASPSSLSIGVSTPSLNVNDPLEKREPIAVGVCTLKNIGYDPFPGGLVELLPTAATATVPSWVRLQSSMLPFLEPGESCEVKVVAKPTPDLASATLATYHLNLRASGGGIVPLDNSVVVTLSSQATASIEFQITDIFTVVSSSNSGFANANTGVVGAAVSIERLDASGRVVDTFTDAANATGWVEFHDIPVGNYKLRVSAAKHESTIEQFTLNPGEFRQRRVNLTYNPVSFTWSVEPVTFEDRYEIKLTTTYETQVPLPVLVLEPGVVNLPALCPGQVYNGEFRLTNHGLVAANHVALPLPKSDQYYRYELMDNFGGRLPAGQTVRIPFRVTCIKAPLGDCDATAPGSSSGPAGAGTASFGPGGGPGGGPGLGFGGGVSGSAGSLGGGFSGGFWACVAAAAGLFVVSCSRAALRHARRLRLATLACFGVGLVAYGAGVIIGWQPCGIHTNEVSVSSTDPCGNGEPYTASCSAFFSRVHGLCPIIVYETDDSPDDPRPPEQPKPTHTSITGIAPPFSTGSSGGSIGDGGHGGGKSSECPPPPPPCKPDCECPPPGAGGGGSGGSGSGAGGGFPGAGGGGGFPGGGGTPDGGSSSWSGAGLTTMDIIK